MLSACSVLLQLLNILTEHKEDNTRAYNELVQTLWSPPGGRQQNLSSNPWCHLKMEKCQDLDRSNILVPAGVLPSTKSSR